jgi:hypothetical protein
MREVCALQSLRGQCGGMKKAVVSDMSEKHRNPHAIHILRDTTYAKGGGSLPRPPLLGL